MNRIAAAPPRAWQRMLSGRRLDLLDPSPFDVEIEDIAHGLSRVARWNGQTSGEWAYSVAQHSVLVERVAGLIDRDLAQRWRLATLLHDAAEYVIGDMITPFKSVIGPDYKTIEAALMRAVHLRVGLPAELPAPIGKLIKRADRVAAYLEATQLAGFAASEARGFFGTPRVGSDIRIEAMSPNEAKQRYIDRFRLLGGTAVC
ncbi:HD family hydrolase [Thalassobaculum sp.]|uniref:HD family hydrolase n=1 Tax=Thalassobaculum sp. TaxID=2022740 RepID=UPI0032EE78AB